jgi:excisionase family DNA binding protein
MKLSYSVKEACAACGFGKEKIYAALHAGELAGKRIDGRTIILREELEKWLREKPEYSPRKIRSNELRRRREPVAA